MSDGTIRIDTVIDGGYMENCYIVRRDDRTDCLIIDPGLDPDAIIEQIEKLGLTPTHILATHGHLDHVFGAAALLEKWPDCHFIIGRRDAPFLKDPQLNLSGVFAMPIMCPDAHRLVEEGDTIEAAGIEFTVLDIPGHTPGHVVYVCTDMSPTRVFVGDVIFAGSIGRTDFPGGDLDTLLSGIREKLFTMPEDTILLSGHGEEMSVGMQRKTNPFAGDGAA